MADREEECNVDDPAIVGTSEDTAAASEEAQEAASAAEAETGAEDADADRGADGEPLPESGTDMFEASGVEEPESGLDHEPGDEPESGVDHDADQIQESATEGAPTRSGTCLPISKIKKIMKFDPEVTMANQDAVFLIAKATEMFIEVFVKHAGAATARAKRKTVQKRDLECAVDSVNNFAFLEGVLETM